jgi:mRNA guanylyltransferase
LKQKSIYAGGRGFFIKPKNMYRAEDTKYVLEQVLPNLPHGQDGLIYTSVNRRYSIGTDPSLIKWKPPYLNSVDFILRSIIGGDNKTYYQLYVGERNVISNTYEQTFKDWVTVTEQEKLELNIRGNEVVAEAVWDKERETIMMRKEQGSSKLMPGTSRIGGWKLIRIRDDKKTSNDVETYNSVKQSIEDNVLEHDLIQALSVDLDEDMML